MIVWRGVSQLDGVTPIALVLTGIRKRSGNAKTGGMIQSYIVLDGMHPNDAIRTGADAAICGDCPHRGANGKGRTCYVGQHTGLAVVGKLMRAGIYPEVSLEEAAELITGRKLRIGTYGDPCAVPIHVWDELGQFVAGWTGYTHQWKRFPQYKRFLMASVDAPSERAWAKLEGWRTFRVRRVTSTVEPLAAGEIACPASKEAGARTTCERCGLCSGSAKGARDVAIVDHSTSARLRLAMLPHAE